MRYIDIRDNKIPAKATKDLIDSLSLNKNIVNFDIRENPCYNDALRTKIAIRLVKNIETLKKRKEILKKNWINLEVLKIEIPQDMRDAIKQVYGVEVNNDQQEAEEKIIGKPTFDNFRPYNNGSLIRSAKASKKNYENSYINNNHKKSESRLSSDSKRGTDKNHATKVDSAKDIKLNSKLYNNNFYSRA